MRFIPWRSKTGNLRRQSDLRGIGVKLARNGFNAMAGRTIVPWFEKMFWVGHGLTSAIRSRVVMSSINRSCTVSERAPGGQ